MIIIDETLISDEVYTEYFVCDLPACLGCCCVYGDAGAPLEKKEAEILNEIFPHIKHFLRTEGIEAIEKSGTSVRDIEGEYTTPLVHGKECAYVIFDEKLIAKCGIEKAWNADVTDFRKPLSCHLYPIRIKKFSNYEGVNYHRWPICDPARKLGKKSKLRVFEFLKEALIRKYGNEWYAQLEAYVSQYKDGKD